MSTVAFQPGAPLSKRLKQRLKPWFFGGRRLIAKTLFAYSPRDLEGAVRSLGVCSGSTMLVHSGFPAESGFKGTPGDVIDVLLRTVAPDGNLLMMSIPYKGSSQRYAEGSPVFDLARTPSAVGIVSEVFRRRPDVHRSASPLHPVLAAGPLAAWLTSDHDVLPHSCGPGTPFERFLNLDGVFVFLDAPFSSLTFMHYVEHLHRHTLPAGLYHAEAAVVKLVDLSGHERLVRQFYFSKAARAHRSFAAVERALVEEGTMRTARVGGSRLLRVRAKDVVAAADRLVARGEALYR